MQVQTVEGIAKRSLARRRTASTRNPLLRAVNQDLRERKAKLLTIMEQKIFKNCLICLIHVGTGATVRGRSPGYKPLFRGACCALSYFASA